MSAIGAVTGNGVYAELNYQGRTFQVAQWYNDAMDAVCTQAFLKSSRMVQMMGGAEKALAQREVALARSFALGGFNFDSIVQDGGLDHDDDLLSVFLWKLLLPHDATIRPELALEMVKTDRQAVVDAVSRANPRSGQPKENAGQAVPPSPGAFSGPGSPSETPGKTIGT